MRNAWRDFDPTRKGSKTNNAWQIDKGLFISDGSKNFFGRVWEVISRITWQLPQTVIGYTAGGFNNLFGGVESVDNWGGATVIETYASKWGAFTMGSFIQGSNGISADPDNLLFQHEYGHYLQSQAAGPLYIGKYALPSAYSANNNDRNHDHDYHSVEQDANIRALKYFEKRYPGFGLENNNKSRWDFKENPINGYNSNESIKHQDNQRALKDGTIKAYGHPLRDFTHSILNLTIIGSLPSSWYYNRGYPKTTSRIIK